MKDFSLAGLVWAVIVVFIFFSMQFGFGLAKNSIKDGCSDFGKFSIDKSIYECKLIKNKP